MQRTTDSSSETLADILNEVELSDDQLGALLGYSGPAIGHWRNKRAVPNAKVWHHIARLTGRTVEQIACAIARGVQRVPGRRTSATVPSRPRR